MRGEDAGPLIAAGRLTVIDERSVNGLGDVPGRLRDPVRDVGGELRAIPYLWSPQLFLARSKAFGDQPPTSLRALFSRRQAVRTALPDSPLELAVAARYLGIGDPFALARDELTSARRGRRACESPAPPLQQRHAAARALPAGRDRPCAGQSRDAGQSARRDRGDPARVRARSPPSACWASSRARRGVAARGALAGALLAPARAGRPVARARVDARTQRDLRHARRKACKTVQRALSRTLANSAVAVHPVPAEGVTGWPEWVGEWVLLRS